MAKGLLSEQDYQKRLEICGNCPFIWNGHVPMCTKCGCLIKIKARFGMFSCPEDKWPKETTETNLTQEQQATELSRKHGCNSCGHR